jgi:hypothetical protein
MSSDFHGKHTVEEHRRDAGWTGPGIANRGYSIDSCGPVLAESKAGSVV